MSRITFHPSAEMEISEAVELYERERRDLGVELLSELEGALALLDRYPGPAPKVGQRVRGLVLGRFPYSLIYRVLGDGQVRILAVAHQLRRPRHWSGRR
jgi:toxin ParE1/3/4